MVRRGRLIFICGDVFLDEVLGAYESSRRLDLLIRWLPFVTNSDALLCEELATIWHQELVQGLGLNSPIFMRRAKRTYMLERFLAAEPDGTWDVAALTADRRGVIKRGRMEERKRLLALRGEVAWSVKYERQEWPDQLRSPSFNAFRSSYLGPAGRRFIENDIKSRNPRGIANRWVRSPTFYPYFTQFITNQLYFKWHSIWKQDQAIDPNGRQDLDIMTHLLRADMIVSNEEKFLQTAFDQLWRKKGKVLLSSRQFVELLPKLM